MTSDLGPPPLVAWTGHQLWVHCPDVEPGPWLLAATCRSWNHDRLPEGAVLLVPAYEDDPEPGGS